MPGPRRCCWVWGRRVALPPVSFRGLFTIDGARARKGRRQSWRAAWRARCPDIRRAPFRIRTAERERERAARQSVLKVLQSPARCAVYDMLDGLSSNVSSGHNTKMYTTALGPSYMLYAIRMPYILPIGGIEESPGEFLFRAGVVTPLSDGRATLSPL